MSGAGNSFKDKIVLSSQIMTLEQHNSIYLAKNLKIQELYAFNRNALDRSLVQWCTRELESMYGSHKECGIMRFIHAIRGILVKWEGGRAVLFTYAVEVWKDSSMALSSPGLIWSSCLQTVQSLT